MYSLIPYVYQSVTFKHSNFSSIYILVITSQRKAVWDLQKHLVVCWVNGFPKAQSGHLDLKNSLLWGKDVSMEKVTPEGDLKQRE